jgi:hypothetical protein
MARSRGPAEGGAHLASRLAIRPAFEVIDLGRLVVSRRDF